MALAFRPARASLALAAALTLAAATAHAQGEPPQVTVAPPLASRVAQWDEFTGRFEAMERVEVRPRVSGYIDQVNFRDGSTVKQGDLLFTIDRRPFRLVSAPAAYVRLLDCQGHRDTAAATARGSTASPQREGGEPIHKLVVPT